MVRTLTRRYEFTPREVREAILSWLKEHDIPRPDYVESNDMVEWTHKPDGGIEVGWVLKDEI